jgi:PAS domain S-box-containing protein
MRISLDKAGRSRRVLLGRPARACCVFFCLLFGYGLWLGGRPLASPVGAVSGVQALNLTAAERAFLAAHPVIRAGHGSNYPPFNWAFGAEPSQGYSIELLDLLALRLGVKVVYEAHGSFERLLEQHRSGSLDLLLSVYRTPERAKQGLFSEPYYRMKQVFVTRTDAADLSDFAQLHGKTVAVGKGWGQQEFLAARHPQIKQFSVANAEAMLDAVSQGQADATVEGQAVVQYWLRKKGISDLKIAGWAKQVDEQKSQSFHFFARPGSPELVSLLNKAMAALSAEDLQALQGKWFGSTGSIQEGHQGVVLSPAERAYLAEKGVIKFCVEPDWLPYVRINERQQTEGIVADTMALMQQRLGLKFELLPTRTWSESLLALRQRRCDVLPMATNIPSRHDAMTFSRPTMVEPLVIATHAREFFVKDTAAIGSRKIGITKGFSFAEQLRALYPAIQIADVDNARDGLERVRKGELWGYVDAMGGIGYVLQKHSMMDLKIAGRLEANVESSIASRSDEPLLAGIMQKAADSVSEEERRAIANRWVSVRFEQGFDYGLMWRVMGAVGGLGGLAVGVVLFWNRRLAKINKALDLAQTSLRQTSNELEIIFQNAGIGIAYSKDRRLLRVNKALADMLGYQQSELVGQATRMFYPNQAVYDKVGLAYAAIAKGEVFRIEVMLKRADGSEVLCEQAGSMVDAADPEKGTIWTLQDVTELRRTQLQLIQSEKLATLGQLVASVAHEINSPIGAVKSSGEQIAEALDELLDGIPALYERLDAAQRQLFRRLITHSRQLDKLLSSREERVLNRALTQQLLELGFAEPHGLAARLAGRLLQLRAEAEVVAYLPLLRHPERDFILSVACSTAAVVGATANINLAVGRVAKIVFALKSFARLDPSAEKRAVQLADTIEMVLTIYQHQIKQVCELQRHYEALPPLLCYADELNQVWTNLIHNALQAMGNKGVLRISIRQEGEQAVVAISDSGCGIPEAILGRIFDPFFTTKPVGEGSGLGLDIVKKIVDKHGGRIEVQSEVGAGATFSVYLPLAGVAA